MTTYLYIIRHAEAEGNIFRRFHGQYDARVTQNGDRQIQALEQRFRGVQIDAVYTSDLYRARRTAKALWGPRGLTPIPEPRFREVNAGVWEDKPFGELEHFDPVGMDNFTHHPELWHAEGAETYEEYSRRFVAGLTAAAEANPGKTIAVFTHGCVISGGLHMLFGLDHDTSRSDNTSVNLLKYENGVFTAEYLFDNSHLSEAISTRARQRWWREHGGRFNLWFRDPVPGDRQLYDRDFWPPKGHRLWIAMLEDQPVGYVTVGGGTVSCLYLLPQYRHRRMGDQLYGQAVTTLRREGVERLSIGVPTTNLEALAFFLHHGASPVQMDDAYTVYDIDISIN